MTKRVIWWKIFWNLEYTHKNEFWFLFGNLEGVFASDENAQRLASHCIILEISRKWTHGWKIGTRGPFFGLCWFYIIVYTMFWKWFWPWFSNIFFMSDHFFRKSSNPWIIIQDITLCFKINLNHKLLINRFLINVNDKNIYRQWR